ncbi:hypothetical protein ZHAWSFBX_CDS_0041 [Agrobacterium phage Alfirin]|nr:hypothetical protein ZHAWSFBX_CDS_0041 [Agrobacterium phage Alfirin]
MKLRLKVSILKDESDAFNTVKDAYVSGRPSVHAVTAWKAVHGMAVTGRIIAGLAFVAGIGLGLLF